MKVYIGIFRACLAVLVFTAFGGHADDAGPRTPYAIARSILDARETPDPPDDLFSASLQIRRRYWPEIDNPAGEVLFNRLVANTKRDLEGAESCAEIVKIMNRNVFGPAGVRSRGKASGYVMCPADVMSLRKGDCSELTLLYIALGQRLEKPVRARLTPYHMYAQYGDDECLINIETTADGLNAPSDAYDEHFVNRTRQGVYAMPLSMRQTLAICLVETGAVLITQGRVDDAIEANVRAARLFPEFLGSYSHLSTLYDRKQNPDAALGFMEMAIERDPSHFLSLERLAGMYWRRSDPRTGEIAERALSLFEETIRARVWMELPRKQVVKTQAESGTDTEDKPFEQYALKELTGLAMADSEAGELERAGAILDYLEKKLTPSETAAIVYPLRSYIALRGGEHGKAMEFARKAHEAQSRSGHASNMALLTAAYRLYAHYADWLRLNGELDKALAHAQIAAEIGPHNANIQAVLGNVFLARKEWAKALEIFENGLALEPKNQYCIKGVELARSQLPAANE